MFTSIVIGIDEHHGGRDALALADRLAAPGARLTLAHTRPDANDLAEALGADLIVIGATRHDERTGPRLDDGNRAALNGAPCAVAIARPGEAGHTGPIQNVGVGYEPTDTGAAALRSARDVSTGLGAELHAMRVVSALPCGRLDDPLVDVEQLEAESVQRAVHIRQQLQSLGGLTAHVERGAAACHLEHFSAEVDLLVVGSRGYGPAAQTLMGSTGIRLARDCHSSLLVTPRPAPVGTIVPTQRPARQPGVRRTARVGRAIAR